MNSTLSTRLTKSDYQRLLSPYLQEGRKHESWSIDEVEIEGERLQAAVSMRSTYVSPTDNGGFHLTVFSTLEFLSQLLIIFGHVREGLAEKTREAWMVECNTRITRAIRDPGSIHVDMLLKQMRKLRDNYYYIAEFKVTDRLGGLFNVELKGFM